VGILERPQQVAGGVRRPALTIGALRFTTRPREKKTFPG
jgi:hypothetical protein